MIKPITFKAFLKPNTQQHEKNQNKTQEIQCQPLKPQQNKNDEFIKTSPQNILKDVLKTEDDSNKYNINTENKKTN